jgi:hypothetical protein
MKKLAVLVVVLASGFGLTHLISSGAAEKQQKEKATSIEVGVMTEKQREHSKLFDTYRTNRRLDIPPGPKDPAGKSEMQAYVEPPIEAVAGDAPSLSFEDFLKNLTCTADVVAIVAVQDKYSQLTESREFLFTDYTVEVKEIFRNNPSAPIQPGGSITVARPGGKVEIKGRVVSALDSSFQSLESGEHYLLFLKHVPATGAYQSLRKGSFLLRDNELVKLTEEHLPGGNNDVRPFTYSVRNTLYATCNR